MMCSMSEYVWDATDFKVCPMVGALLKQTVTMLNFMLDVATEVRSDRLFEHAPDAFYGATLLRLGHVRP
jgi:hypothetical protein